VPAPDGVLKWCVANRIQTLLGVTYPVVQAPMTYIARAELAAAVSEAGGLGILASATMTLPELRTAIGKVKSRTSNPFGVNLLPNQADLLGARGGRRAARVHLRG